MKNLDILYDEKNNINTKYTNLKKKCQIVWFCCLGLSILSIVGIIGKLYTPDVFWIHLYIIVTVIIFLFAISNLLILLIRNNTIKDEWEKQQILG